MTATVTHLDTRRAIPCQWCHGRFTPSHLDMHLRFDCPVLEARRNHPSTWTDNGGIIGGVARQSSGHSPNAQARYDRAAAIIRQLKTDGGGGAA